jgi:hypothetical protein
MLNKPAAAESHVSACRRSARRMLARCRAATSIASRVEAGEKGHDAYALLEGVVRPGPENRRGSAGAGLTPGLPQDTLGFLSWWTAGGSNPRPPDCESAAFLQNADRGGRAKTADLEPGRKALRQLSHMRDDADHAVAAVEGV